MTTLTIVKAGEYKDDLLTEVGRIVRGTFNRYMANVTINPSLYDFSKFLYPPEHPRHRHMPWYMLDTIAWMLEGEIQGSYILCFITAPIRCLGNVSEGLAQEGKRTVFVSTGYPHMSHELTDTLILRRWQVVSVHEFGHSIAGLPHHDDQEQNYTNNGLLCPMYPTPDDANPGEFLDRSATNFCDECLKQLGA